MKVIKRVYLKSMPFDKWVGNENIHATGCSVLLEDGSWHTEYVDDMYEDADDCVYEDEYEEE